MKVYVVVAVVTALGTLGSYLVWRRRHNAVDETPLTRRWLSDHQYDRDGDRG